MFRVSKKNVTYKFILTSESMSRKSSFSDAIKYMMVDYHRIFSLLGVFPKID